MAFAWLQSLDPRPYFPAYSGPYLVGSIDVEIPVDALAPGIKRPDPSISTIAFRAYYPCQNPSSDSKATPNPVYWIPAPQREILGGYARFCGAGSLLANFLSLFPTVLHGITIPVLRNAPLANAPTDDARWPTIIFSHGLGGSRNAYSHICGSLASYGMVVLAPDHRDGSQPVALMRKTPIAEACRAEYRFMKHSPCEETFAGRDQQLAVRLWEVCSVLDAAHRIDTGNDYDELHCAADGTNPVKSALAAFKDRLAIHEPGSVAFAGHSFGGTTTVQLVKSAFYHPDVSTSLFTVDAAAPSPPRILQQVTGRTRCLLLDPWAMPWTSPATSALAARPMPCFSGSTATARDADAFIAILSKSFFAWRLNLRGVKQILHDQRADAQAHAHIFYPHTSAHLSQSDFAVLFPALTRHLAGDPDPDRTFDLNLRGCLEVLRRAGSRWAAIAEKRPASDEDRVDAYLASLALDEKPNAVICKDVTGDHNILLREPDLIRGWVAVDLTDPALDGDAEDDAVAAAAATVAAAEVAPLGAEQSSSTKPGEDERGAKAGGRSGVRIVLRRAGSSGRIRSLRDVAVKTSKGHARRVSKALLATGAPVA